MALQYSNDLNDYRPINCPSWKYMLHIKTLWHPFLHSDLGLLILSHPNTTNTSECNETVITAFRRDNLTCFKDSEANNNSYCSCDIPEGNIKYNIELKNHNDSLTFWIKVGNEMCSYMHSLSHPTMQSNKNTSEQPSGIYGLVILSLLTIIEALIIAGLVVKMSAMFRIRHRRRLKAARRPEVAVEREFCSIANGEVVTQPKGIVLTDTEEPPPVNEGTLRRMLKSNSRGRLTLESNRSTRSNSFQLEQVPPYNQRMLPTPYEDIGAPRFGSPLSPTNYFNPTGAEENPYQQVTLDHTDGGTTQIAATTRENTGGLGSMIDCVASPEESHMCQLEKRPATTSLPLPAAGKSEGIYHTLEPVTEEQQLTVTPHAENLYHVLDIRDSDEESVNSAERSSPIQVHPHTGLSLGPSCNSSQKKEKRLKSASDLPSPRNPIYYTLEFNQLEGKDTSQERSQRGQKQTEYSSKRLKQSKSTPTPLQPAHPKTYHSQFENCNPITTLDHLSEHQYQAIGPESRAMKKHDNRILPDGDAAAEKHSAVKEQNSTDVPPKSKTVAENPYSILEIGDSDSEQDQTVKQVPVVPQTDSTSRQDETKSDYFTLLVSSTQNTVKHDYCSLIVSPNPAEEPCTDTTKSPKADLTLEIQHVNMESSFEIDRKNNSTH